MKDLSLVVVDDSAVIVVSYDDFVVDFLPVIKTNIYFIIVVFVRESRAAAVTGVVHSYMIVIDVVKHMSYVRTCYCYHSV